MSVEQIIKHAAEKNPLAMKEALEGELRSRIAVALEAKMNDEDDDEDDEDGDDEDDEDDEDEDDMDESVDLSSLTIEELEDFIESDEFDSLDEETQDAVMYYYEGSIKGSGTDRKAQLKKAYRAGEQDTRQFNRPGGMPTNKPNRGADSGVKTAYEKGRMSSGGDSAAKGASRTTSQDTLKGTDKVPDWAKGSRGEKKIRRDNKAYAMATSKPRGQLPK